MIKQNVILIIYLGSEHYRLSAKRWPISLFFYLHDTLSNYFHLFVSTKSNRCIIHFLISIFFSSRSVKVGDIAFSGGDLGQELKSCPSDVTLETGTARDVKLSDNGLCEGYFYCYY